MSATHIGIASAAVIPECLAIMSHFDACVPRRSITRSKSNIGTVAPGLLRIGFKSLFMDSARAVLAEQYRVRAVYGVGAVGHRLLQRSRLNRDVFGKEPRHRHVALRIAAVAIALGGQRFAGQHAAAERR